MTRSRTEPVHGVLIGHGDVPRALVDAAASIVGDHTGLSVISNIEMSVAEMERRLDEELATHPSGVILFVDMYGSSCFNVGSRGCRNRPNVEVICGVNLPMLIRFLSYRRRLSVNDLSELMHRTGQESVRGRSD